MTESDAIDSIVIHPAIGIARVGNSPNDYFLGPELAGSIPNDGATFRDAEGRIKRQAARFRLYGLNQDGEIVREITAEGAEIKWTVHVANKKAAWYEFQQALDIPASLGQIAGVPPMVNTRRNITIQGEDRKSLAIDPGPRTISGMKTNNAGDQQQYAFDTGKFFDEQVYLGELRTDEKGRLVFLGGRGRSASKGDVPVTPREFANNDWWRDDTSDGPIDAVVKIGDREYQATGAWVIVAPPDYAPGIQAIITGYDMLFEVGVNLSAKSLSMPGQPSFTRHIAPILRRLSQYQWVNAGFQKEFGWGSPLDFTDAGLLARLADNSDATRQLRQSIFDRFRDGRYPYLQSEAWPAIYGDGVDFNLDSLDPRNAMGVLAIQYGWLRQWAEGQFVSDFDSARKVDWDSLSPAEQADSLDEAALENTIGGPFHPGAEFTWPIRIPLLYSAPFRIKRRSVAASDWGPVLTPQIALAATGPLDGSSPGDLTQWMACPWQTDTASCLSGYVPFAGEYLPTFWPARVPNDVLTADALAIVSSPGASIDRKLATFAAGNREKWLREIVYKPGVHPAVLIRMPLPTQVFVSEWWRVGIVERREILTTSPSLPGEVWSETERSVDEPAVLNAGASTHFAHILEHDPNDIR